MKKFAITIQLLLLFAVLSITMQAQQWQSIWTGVTDDLYDICCIDENTIFVCGQNGVILKSVNGGVTWQEKHRNPNWEIVDLKFTDNGDGYGLVLENNTYFFIIKSDDYGESWHETTADKNAMRDKCLDEWTYGKPVLSVSNNTICVLVKGELYKSTNSGFSFEYIDLGLDAYNTVAYFNSYFGLVVGRELVNENILRIWKTDDGGVNWENTANHEFSFCHVSCLNLENCEHAKMYGDFVDVNNSQYNIIESSDGFANITMIPDESLFYLVDFINYLDIDYINGRGCFINSIEWTNGTVTSKVCVSDENGTSWLEVSNGLHTDEYMYDLSVVNSDFMIASENGNLYKYIDNPSQYINENSSCIQVFPNPTYDAIVIITENALDIIIYDALGRIVFKGLHGREYVVLDVSSLNPGIFFVVIIDNKKKQLIQKMIKL